MYDVNTLTFSFLEPLCGLFFCSILRIGEYEEKYDFIILRDIFFVFSFSLFALSQGQFNLHMMRKSVCANARVCVCVRECVGQFRYNEKHASQRHIDAQILCTCKIPIYHFMQEIFFILSFHLSFNMRWSHPALSLSLSFCHSLPSQVNGNKDFKSCQVERADSQIDWICRAGWGRRTAGASTGLKWGASVRW